MWSRAWAQGAPCGGCVHHAEVVRANTNATIIMMAERIADWIKVGK
jgi:bacterioferritin-associated ferredoxin